MLCECWVIEELARLESVIAEMRRFGFEACTLKFLMTDVVFGRRTMTKARWNNVIAPVLLPLVGYPGGPMMYCMITATKE